MKRNYLMTLSLMLVLAGCASQEQLRRTLLKNPDIVFETIEKNPEKFYEVSSKASAKAREVLYAKQKEEERKQREEEFKNPKMPDISPDRAVRGNPNAAFTIVTYSDFQCPYCKKGYLTTEEIRKKYGDRLRFVFKNLPLPMHPMAVPAARRFEAIALQNTEKAYQFHDELFNSQDKLSSGGEKYLDETAKEIGVDMKKMAKDMDSEIVTKRLEADKNEAAKFGLSGTPAFIVAGVTLKGAQPASSFEEIIERRIRETEPPPAAPAPAAR